MNEKPVLGVIGCGQMAYAIVKGLKSSPDQLMRALHVYDIDSVHTSLFKEEFQATVQPAHEVVDISDIIFLAVKPQQITEVLSSTREHWTEQKVLISIAAGVTTENIEAVLAAPIPVIRTMPNIAALIGKSATALCTGKYTTPEQMALAETFMRCVGETFVYPEKYIDAFGAIAGSGPAYACLMVEAWVDAAVMLGIPFKDAEKMVLTTLQGTLELLTDGNTSAAELKQKICSPGGTTIRALKKFEERGLRTGFFEAAQAAYDRSIELAKS